MGGDKIKTYRKGGRTNKLYYYEFTDGWQACFFNTPTKGPLQIIAPWLIFSFPLGTYLSPNDRFVDRFVYRKLKIDHIRWLEMIKALSKRKGVGKRH